MRKKKENYSYWVIAERGSELYESRCNLEDDYVWKSYISMLYIVHVNEWGVCTSGDKGVSMSKIGNHLTSFLLNLWVTSLHWNEPCFCLKIIEFTPATSTVISGTYCNFQLFVFMTGRADWMKWINYVYFISDQRFRLSMNGEQRREE